MVELRKVQALQGERSLTVVLPKEFAVTLGISKGDFLKVHVENKKLILEKAEV
jgi:bifunctional DNA-binding transcriptional regulator/antitoxin component of YhaV-PrlF toxin-antitoxin module